MAGVSNRVALVTGGGQGIGAAIAKRLADDGARVAVLDINEQSAINVASTLGRGAIGIGADISNRTQVLGAIDRIVSECGGLHILVNNAGVIRDNLLHKMSDEDWRVVIEVHLRGAFIATQIAQTHMVKNKYGRIVFLSSTSALGNRGQSNYSTAKAGLQGLMKTVAIELGPFGITSNAVAPGFIETPMTKATSERIGMTIEQMREQVAQSIPMRRGGLPEDVANAVAFLTAEEAGYVTGQVLYIDGGSSLI